MKLGEKIQCCRKKAGMSQDTFAELVGVSRQAISKWELGEATPDIHNLAAIAKIFNVTVDWLISEEDTFEADISDPKDKDGKRYEAFFDTRLKWLRKMIKKYGWLSGIYLAACGLGICAIGILVKVAVSGMFRSFGNISSSMSGVMGDPFGSGEICNSFFQNNPVSLMANFFIAIGIIMVIAGIVLALYLRKMGRK